MIPVEIRKETGMSLTEQRKQPAWYMDLEIKDMQVKRRIENAAIKKTNKGTGKRSKGRGR